MKGNRRRAWAMVIGISVVSAGFALPDGQVIAAYGHYLLGAAVLIKWNPSPKL